MNTRAIAAKAILDIIDNNYSLLTLEQKLSKQNLAQSDKSFIKMLCYAFFRNFYSLEKIVNSYVSSNTKQKAKVLIMLGLLQILEINQPVYASINETVAASKNLKIVWAKKLVNGVLRKASREIESLSKQYNEYKKLDLPEWILKSLKKQYPKNYQNIAQSLNSKANMFIRLNQSKDPQKVLDFLNENKITYSTTKLLDNCVKLDQAIDVKNNQLFKQGYFTVQDMSAQYTGHIINPTNNDKILDACAAPGGKVTHILELAPQANITAIDILDRRLELLKENISRVSPNHKTTIKKHDLTQPFDGRFNKIILDAPCSALGTIKRNPDIKVLRTLEDVKNIINLQTTILQNLWDNNLEDNGYLLYVTCSILRQENQQQIKLFLDKNQNANIVDIDILSNFKTDYGYQILPTQENGDGFFYCLIKKEN